MQNFRGVETLVTVKMLKPYYIKTDDKHIQVILAYRYFSILIKEQVYHFIPTEEKEIIIDRKTKRIINIGAKFAFQKDEDIIYFTMAELISLPDFLLQLYLIVESYYFQGNTDSNHERKLESDYVMQELEHLNIMRLIDHALDHRDQKAFDLLVKCLS